MKPTVKITAPDSYTNDWHFVFEPPLFVQSGPGSTTLVLSAEEKATLQRAMYDADAEQAVASADATRSCPVCGAPLLLGEPCGACLRELRCDP